MKKQVHPAFMVLFSVCAIGIAVYYLFHAATDKPYYPGWNVSPGGGPGMTKEQGEAMSKAGLMPKPHVFGTEDPQDSMKKMGKGGKPGAPGAPGAATLGGAPGGATMGGFSAPAKGGAPAPAKEATPTPAPEAPTKQ